MDIQTNKVKKNREWASVTKKRFNCFIRAFV